MTSTLSEQTFPPRALNVTRLGPEALGLRQQTDVTEGLVPPDVEVPMEGIDWAL
jgi:hypothetical protein